MTRPKGMPEVGATSQSRRLVWPPFIFSRLETMGHVCSQSFGFIFSTIQSGAVMGARVQGHII